MRTKSRPVYGVGINDAKYQVHLTETFNGRRRTVWTCPFYSKWVSMLARCYSNSFKLKSPTYADCSVIEAWHIFSCFKMWMQTQDWQGKELDKDLITHGNKIYSPATCLFVSRRVNTFVLERGSSRGEWPIGVYFSKSAGKFVSRCNDVLAGKLKFLGYFECQEEAHQKWLQFKREQALILASQESDPVVSRHLIRRYENYGANQ